MRSTSTCRSACGRRRAARRNRRAAICRRPACWPIWRKSAKRKDAGRTVLLAMRTLGPDGAGRRQHPGARRPVRALKRRAWRPMPAASLRGLFAVWPRTRQLIMRAPASSTSTVFWRCWAPSGAPPTTPCRPTGATSTTSWASSTRRARRFASAEPADISAYMRGLPRPAWRRPRARGGCRPSASCSSSWPPRGSSRRTRRTASPARRRAARCPRRCRWPRSIA